MPVEKLTQRKRLQLAESQKHVRFWDSPSGLFTMLKGPVPNHGYHLVPTVQRDEDVTAFVTLGIISGWKTRDMFISALPMEAIDWSDVKI